MAKQADEAASAYERAAEHYQISKSNHEAARSFVEAARCRKDSGSPEAIAPYHKVMGVRMYGVSYGYTYTIALPSGYFFCQVYILACSDA